MPCCLLTVAKVELLDLLHRDREERTEVELRKEHGIERGDLADRGAHGEDLGPIGVQVDSYVDGKATQWSWKCFCGEWYDGIDTRKEALREYREHAAKCVWAKKRVPCVTG